MTGLAPYLTRTPSWRVNYGITWESMGYNGPNLLRTPFYRMITKNLVKNGPRKQEQIENRLAETLTFGDANARKDKIRGPISRVLSHAVP
jgi:hypothetical protein